MRSCGDIGKLWRLPARFRALHARPTRAPAPLLPGVGSEGQVSQLPALPVTASSLGELANASRTCGSKCRPAWWLSRQSRHPTRAEAQRRTGPGDDLPDHLGGEGRTPISVACQLLGVSRSGYHAWSTRAPSDRALSDAWLTERIEQIHAANRQVYGSRRVQAELRLRYGIDVSRKRIQRRMRGAELSGLPHESVGARRSGCPAFASPTTSSSASSVPLHRTSSGPPTSPTCAPGRGWLYLAAVQDAYSRRIVGWSMADHMRSELVVDALQMALHRRRPGPGLVHHFRAGQPVRVTGLRPASPRRRHRRLDGQPRRLLRQRRRRELLRHPQKRSSFTAKAGRPAAS
jgi:hypothetical protein